MKEDRHHITGKSDILRIDRAAITLEEAMVMVEKEPSRSASFFWLGVAHYNEGQVDAALGAMVRALDLSQGREDTLYILHWQGSILSAMNRNKEALEQYHKCLALATEARDSAIQVGTANRIAEILHQTGRGKDALPYLENALLLESQQKEKARIRHNLGYIRVQMKQYDTARNHFLAALWMLRKEPERYGLLIPVMLNLGDVYTALGNYNQAQRYLNKALKQAIATGNVKMEAVAYDLFGDLYEAREDHGRAKNCFLQAITLYREIGFQENIKPALLKVKRYGESLKRGKLRLAATNGRILP